MNITTLKLSEEVVHKEIIPAFKIKIPAYVSYGVFDIAPGDSISFIVKKPNEVFYYIGLQDARMEGISISVTPVTDSVVLQDKVITPTTEEQIVTADEGYNGLGTVTVNAMNLGTKTITASDTYNAVDDEFDGYSSVIVDVPYNSNTKATPNEFTIQKNLEEISIPYGCTSIGDNGIKSPDYMTTGYPNIKRINIPSSVTTLKSSCFAYMKALENIDIPETVSILYSGLFYGCSNLIEVALPIDASYQTENTTQTTAMFSDCESLTSFILPSSTTAISSHCFTKCKSLTSVNVNGQNVLPNGITVIDAGAFERCTSLREIILPTSLDSIGGYAFRECSSLTHIEIPAAVTTIASDAFGSCTALETITVNKAEGSISGAPWGATNAQVVWTG